MISGLYKIINKVNKKYYLGSSKNIPRRWKCHIRLLRKNKHHSAHLQNAWNKYGSASFEFVVIKKCKESKLILKEQIYLDLYTPWKSSIGYNISPSAIRNDTISNHPNKENILKKLSKSLKLAHKNVSKKDRKIWNQNISKALKGRVFSETHSKNKSLSQTGNKNHQYGKKWSKKKRLAQSIRRKGINNCQLMRKVSINGEIYESVLDACRALEINRGKMRGRLDSSTKKFKGYKYIS